MLYIYASLSDCIVAMLEDLLHLLYLPSDEHPSHFRFLEYAQKIASLEATIRFLKLQVEKSKKERWSDEKQKQAQAKLDHAEGVRVEETLRGLNDSVLDLLKKHVVGANQCTDQDATEFETDWKGYALEKLNNADLLHLQGFESTLFSNNKVSLSPNEERKKKDIFDLIVQKKGNVRMVVRFNNAHEAAEEKELLGELGENDFGIKISSPSKPRTSMTIRYTAIKHNTYEKVVNHDMKGPGIPDNIGPFASQWGTIHKENLLYENILTDETQQETFSILQPFISSAIDGKPTAVFAYGGTGSGKTYTMGFDGQTTNLDTIGLFPRIVEYLIKESTVSAVDYQIVEIIPSVTEYKQGNNSIGSGELHYRMVDIIRAEKSDYYKNYPRFTSLEKESCTPETCDPELYWNKPKKGASFWMQSVTKTDLETSINGQYRQCMFKGEEDEKNAIPQSSYATLSKAQVLPFNVRETLTKIKYLGGDANDSTYTGPNESNFYEPNRDAKDCERNKNRILSSIMEDLQKTSVPKDAIMTGVMETFVKQVAMRRAEVTLGNEGMSSRTHMIVVFNIKNENGKINQLFLIDLAGKESLSIIERKWATTSKEKKDTLIAKWKQHHRQNQLTLGINLSLNQVTDMMKEKKSNGLLSKKWLMAPRTEYGSKQIGLNPLYGILKKVWDDPNAKLMMIACVYPLASPFFIPGYYEGRALDGWKERFHLKEDGAHKLSRDGGVLKVLSEIQKIKSFGSDQAFGNGTKPRKK
jgi:hypothetical protein